MIFCRLPLFANNPFQYSTVAACFHLPRFFGISPS